MPHNQQTELNRYGDISSVYHRVLSEAPYLPRCSDNKTAARVRPRDYAIRYPYMQVNRQNMVSWLIFDLDHSNTLIWEDENFPAPNLVVRNRANGHAHLYYAIVPVCTSENANTKPIQYMKAVYEAMALRLNADPSYSGPVAKTPGHPWWSTWEIHNTEYTLGELADYVELPVKSHWGAAPDVESVSHSRHCMLFEELRFYAYSIVNKLKDQGTFQSFCRLLNAYAHSKNNYQCRGFDSNLSVAQVNATVKSVSRWTWEKYTGQGNQCARGVMALDKSLPLKQRQSLAAQRTHVEQKSKTESKIEAACKILLQKGERCTQVAVAKVAGLSRQTVAKYRTLLSKPVITPRKLPSKQEGAAPIATNVNFAVHQITAELSRLGERSISDAGSDPDNST